MRTTPCGGKIIKAIIKLPHSDASTWGNGQTGVSGLTGIEYPQGPPKSRKGGFF